MSSEPSVFETYGGWCKEIPADSSVITMKVHEWTTLHQQLSVYRAAIQARVQVDAELTEARQAFSSFTQVVEPRMAAMLMATTKLLEQIGQSLDAFEERLAEMEADVAEIANSIHTKPTPVRKKRKVKR